MKKRPHFSLILAVYNEGPTFENSISQIQEVLKRLKKDWEIIFVEDKSTDGTREVLKKILPNLKNSSAIFHTKNQGRGRTVTDGIQMAKGDICGFLDVDLEVSAHYIPLFIKEIEKGYDVAIGKRHYEKNLTSVSRVLASKSYSVIVKTILNLPISDTEAGYKFFKTDKILPILNQTQDNGWFWDTEICARSYFSNLKLSELPVLFIRRPEKKSTVRLIPDTWDYFKKIIAFRSHLPRSFKPSHV